MLVTDVGYRFLWQMLLNDLISVFSLYLKDVNKTRNLSPTSNYFSQTLLNRLYVDVGDRIMEAVFVAGKFEMFMSDLIMLVTDRYFEIVINRMILRPTS